MRFAVLDPQAVKLLAEQHPGGLILDWPHTELADRAYPTVRRFEPLRGRRRRRLAVDLFRALEDMKRDLHSL